MSCFRNMVWLQIAARDVLNFLPKWEALFTYLIKFINLGRRPRNLHKVKCLSTYRQCGSFWFARAHQCNSEDAGQGIYSLFPINPHPLLTCELSKYGWLGYLCRSSRAMSAFWGRTTTGGTISWLDVTYRYCWADTSWGIHGVFECNLIIRSYMVTWSWWSMFRGLQRLSWSWIWISSNQRGIEYFWKLIRVFGGMALMW